MTDSRIPQVRFEGFEGEWVEKQLGQLGAARAGETFPETEQGGEKGIPFYKVSDMNLSQNQRKMTRANNYVSRLQVERRRWHPIDDLPAIIFAKVGAAVFLGRKRVVEHEFLLDNNMIGYSLDRTQWDAAFARSLFETLDLSSLVQVGALPSFNPPAVEARRVFLPSYREEQRQIGTLLSEMEGLISQHRRKHAKLKQTKVALQQRMLPQGGADQPDLRLAGFNGEWTGDDLGSLCDITIGRTPARNVPAMWGGEVPWVSIADMTQGREILLTKEMITSAGARAGRCISRGTVLLSFKLTIGRVARAGVDLYTNEAIAALPVKRGVAVDALFLMYFLQASDLAGRTNRAAMGATLNQEALREIKVLRPPTLDEQKAIGQIFSKLDDLIAAEQAYIGKLQQTKTGLLQKMFV